jgi:hypothetical protein
MTKRCPAFMRSIEQYIWFLVNHGPDAGPVFRVPARGAPGHPGDTFPTFPIELLGKD